MKEFAALTPKIFGYLTDDSDENKKKATGTRNVRHKTKS